MLVVSGTQPPEGIAMPQLKDLSVQQAVKMLNETGFTSCLVYEEDSTQPSGTVISQSPQQGMQTSLSNSVVLWISTFAEERYSAVLQLTLDIPEPECVIRAVVETPIENITVNIAQEIQVAEAGLQTVTLNLSSIFKGTGTVKIFVNNEQIILREVEFVDEK